MPHPLFIATSSVGQYPQQVVEGQMHLDKAEKRSTPQTHSISCLPMSPPALAFVQGCTPVQPTRHPGLQSLNSTPCCEFSETIMYSVDPDAERYAHHRLGNSHIGLFHSIFGSCRPQAGRPTSRKVDWSAPLGICRPIRPGFCEARPSTSASIELLGLPSYTVCHHSSLHSIDND